MPPYGRYQTEVTMKTILNLADRAFDLLLLSVFVVFGSIYFGAWVLDNVISFAHTAIVLFHLIF